MEQGFTIHLNQNGYTADDNMNLVPNMIEYIISGVVNVDLDNMTVEMTPTIDIKYPGWPLQTISVVADSVTDGVVTFAPDGGGIG